jgi:hypothetical protein
LGAWSRFGSGCLGRAGSLILREEKPH